MRAKFVGRRAQSVKWWLRYVHGRTNSILRKGFQMDKLVLFAYALTYF